jgi:hypothetical protein
MLTHRFDIPSDIFSSLKEVVEDKSECYRKGLSGNMQEEYRLKKYCHLYNDFMLNQIKESDVMMKQLEQMDYVAPNKQSLKLSNLWSNYQKKYEFNPFHKHLGLFSFVLFIQVPYDMDDEIQVAPGRGNQDIPGHLQFLFLDSEAKGGIGHVAYPVDRAWEQTGILFPAHLNHIVYPFYSSDDYRITVSGNITFNNEL